MKKLIAIAALSLLSVANLSNGIELDPDKALHDWQVRRLMDPLPQELEKERTGNVYIYDGLTEREVDTALNTRFGRIQAMMFVGTVKTDTSGEYNMDLSLRRAQSVRDYLVTKGIPSDRLVINGYGESQPIADNTTEEGRFQNRRVELNPIKQ